MVKNNGKMNSMNLSKTIWKRIKTFATNEIEH